MIMQTSIGQSLLDIYCSNFPLLVLENNIPYLSRGTCLRSLSCRDVGTDGLPIWNLWDQRTSSELACAIMIKDSRSQYIQYTWKQCRISPSNQNAPWRTKTDRMTDFFTFHTAPLRYSLFFFSFGFGLVFAVCMQSRTIAPVVRKSTKDIQRLTVHSLHFFFPLVVR